MNELAKFSAMLDMRISVGNDPVLRQLKLSWNVSKSLTLFSGICSDFHFRHRINVSNSVSLLDMFASCQISCDFKRFNMHPTSCVWYHYQPCYVKCQV